MGSFGKIKSQAVRADSERVFTFDTLAPTKGEEPMKLRAVHAGDSNRQYLNDSVRRANESIARASSKLTTAQIDALRDQDADIFARCVVKGWENVYHDDGTEPVFGPDTVADFLRSLPTELFDRFRIWAKDAETFRDPVPSAEDVAKK